MENPLSKSARSIISIKSKLKKELKTLEPHGASDRTFKANTSNIEKSFNDMRTFQFKHDSERARLTEGLHSPIKLVRQGLRMEKIPQKFQKIDFKINSSKKRPENVESCKETPILHKRLDFIMKNCKKLYKENKSALRLLPDLAKETNEKFENFSNIIEYLTSSTPGRKLKDYQDYRNLTERSYETINDFSRGRLRKKSPFCKIKNDMLK
jgi:hypothetical protein